jgi:hypothetical protein
MPEYVVECAECDETYEAETEEEAVGWLFGHSIRTEHTEIEKEQKS